MRNNQNGGWTLHEIFKTITKYNTCQWREEGNPLQMVNDLVNILHYLSRAPLNGRV